MPVIDWEQQTGGIVRSGMEQMVRENYFLDSSPPKMITIPDSQDGVLLEPLSITPRPANFPRPDRASSV